MDSNMSKMFEATRLTREGRLKEATLVIQRALGLGRTPSDTSEPELIEERFRLTDEPSEAATDEGVATEAEHVRPGERPIDAPKKARRATILLRPSVRPSLPGMPL